MRYTNYTNIDADFRRGYGRGDRLVKGYSDEVDDELLDPLSANEILEYIFARHNRDDRPDGKLCPSMSIGDVIVISEIAWTVERDGFLPVVLDPEDLIEDRTWLEVVR